MNNLKTLTSTQQTILAFIVWGLAILCSLSVPRYFPVVAIIASFVLLMVAYRNGRRVS